MSFLTPGMRSSEFMLTVLANVLAILDYAHIWNVMPYQQAALVQTIVTAAYALSRGWAKSGSGISPTDIPVFQPPAPPPAPSPTVTAPSQPPAAEQSQEFRVS